MLTHAIAHVDAGPLWHAVVVEADLIDAVGVFGTGLRAHIVFTYSLIDTVDIFLTAIRLVALAVETGLSSRAVQVDNAIRNLNAMTRLACKASVATLRGIAGRFTATAFADPFEPTVDVLSTHRRLSATRGLTLTGL